MHLTSLFCYPIIAGNSLKASSLVPMPKTCMIFISMCAANLALQMLWRLHLSLSSITSDESSDNSNSITNTTSSITPSSTSPALDVTPSATTNHETRTQTGAESPSASGAPSATGQPRPIERWLRVLMAMARFAGCRSPHICYKAMQAVARLLFG